MHIEVHTVSQIPEMLRDAPVSKPVMDLGGLSQGDILIAN